jgi:hypothetical protein
MRAKRIFIAGQKERTAFPAPNFTTVTKFQEQYVKNSYAELRGNRGGTEKSLSITQLLFQQNALFY